MNSVPRKMADDMANEFAGKGVGFSAQQITDYFTTYSNMVKPYDHYGMNPTRFQLFIDSLYALQPKEQYCALTDLCLSPPQTKYGVPSDEVRHSLLGSLHTYLNPNPIGLRFSQLRDHKYRQEWLTAYGRTIANPAAAITAARTMVETMLKTIVAERGEVPDSSGDVARVLKQVERCLEFNVREMAEQHRVLTGLANVVHGIAGISNASGDRHGLVDGLEIDDPATARLVVNAAGALGLFMIELHLFKPLP